MVSSFSATCRILFSLESFRLVVAFVGLAVELALS